MIMRNHHFFKIAVIEVSPTRYRCALVISSSSSTSHPVSCASAKTSGTTDASTSNMIAMSEVAEPMSP